MGANDIMLDMGIGKGAVFQKEKIGNYVLLLMSQVTASFVFYLLDMHCLCFLAVGIP